MVGTAIHFSVWGGELGGANLDKVLASASRIGFTHVAIPLRFADTLDIAAIRASFERAGVAALTTASLTEDSNLASLDLKKRTNGIERLLHRIRLARDLGATQMNGVIYGLLGKAEGPATPAERRASAEALAEVAAFAQTCGVRLAIEIVNRYETNLLNTVDQAMDYLAMASHPNIALHLDTFHMSIEEADLAEALIKARPVLAYFELCQSGRGDLTKGSVDIANMLEAVRAIGYDGLIGVEALARDRIFADHANLLSVWRSPYQDADAVAERAISLIRKYGPAS